MIRSEVTQLSPLPITAQGEAQVLALPPLQLLLLLA
jgi:hypothetical protein